MALACVLLGGVVAVPAFGQGDKTDTIIKKVGGDDAKPNPILRLAELRLDEYVVPARMINLPLPGRTRTVQDVLDRFEKWSKDDAIGAVLLDVGNIGLSLSDIEELRAGLDGVQGSGKKVFAFLNASGPLGYLLACGADEIVAAPTGNVIIPGLGALFPFMKGYYQMVGLEYDVITAGKYKYPGFLNAREPNKYFQEEYGAILDSWIGDYKAMIADGRGLSHEAVDEAVDIALFDATKAQQRGLIDTLAYYDEYRDRVLRRQKMKRYRGKESGLANVNSIQDLVEMLNESLKEAQEARQAVGPKIAVLHARGPIVDLNLGAGFATQLICRDDFVKVVDRLRKNKSIKAVVMRVDSPGGSGYASDAIWHALRRLGDAKPLVVSMGSVAGSGGYYIACPARRIFAQPTTITGAIGVLGIFQSSWSRLNRMDYEIAEMKRGARALLGSQHRTLAKRDRRFLQDYINEFYGVFIDRVALTRKMPANEVRKIAGGRIYTGRQALDLGLVDELGGLADAIDAAKDMANIPPSAELKILHYPRPGSLGEMFESLSSVGVTQALETLARASAPAPTVPFHTQLVHFATRVQPLCWMAAPDFSPRDTLVHAGAWGMMPEAAPPTPLEALLTGGR